MRYEISTTVYVDPQSAEKNVEHIINKIGLFGGRTEVKLEDTFYGPMRERVQRTFQEQLNKFDEAINSVGFCGLGTMVSEVRF